MEQLCLLRTTCRSVRRRHRVEHLARAGLVTVFDGDHTGDKCRVDAPSGMRVLDLRECVETDIELVERRRDPPPSDKLDDDVPCAGAQGALERSSILACGREP